MIDSLAFSPDGTRLLSGSWDGTAKLWNVDTGQLLHTFWLGEHVRSVAWSPDGRTIAIAGDSFREAASRECLRWRQDTFGVRPIPEVPKEFEWRHACRVRLHDADSGQLLHQFEGKCDKATFSPDGQTLAMTGWGVLELFDLTHGQLLRQATIGNRWFRNVGFSTDGTQIAAMDDNGVWIFDAKTLDIVAVAVDEHLWPHTTLEDFAGSVMQLQNDQGQPNPMMERPNWAELDRCRAKGELCPPPLESFQHVVKYWRELLPGIRPASSNDGGMNYQRIAFSPVESKAAVLLSTMDLRKPGTVYVVGIMEVPTGHVERFIVPFKQWTRTIAFAPDGATIACAGDEQRISIWNVSTGEQIRLFGNPPSPVQCVTVASTQPWVVAIDDSGVVSVHNFTTRKLISSVQSVPDPTSLQIAPNDDVLLVGCSEGTLQFLELPSLQPRQLLGLDPERFVGGSFSPDGLRFVAVSDTPDPGQRYTAGTNPHVVEWSLADGRILRREPIEGEDEIKPYSVAGSPDRQRLAVLTNHHVLVCDLNAEADMRPKSVIRLNKREFWKIAFAGSSSQILLADQGYGMYLADLPSKSTVASFNATQDVPSAFAFTSDAKLMARSTAVFNEVQIFEMPRGVLIKELVGHQASIRSLAIYRDQLVISGGADGTVKFWNLDTGELLSSLLRLPSEQGAQEWEWLA